MVSVSRVELQLRVPERGAAKAEVFRHLAPVTVGLLLRSLPLQARISRQIGGVVSILTSLEAGPEKLRNHFDRGEIALQVASGQVWVFLQPVNLPRGLNPVGRVTAGMAVLEEARAGDTATILAA
jgi:hypothetical protein